MWLVTEEDSPTNKTRGLRGTPLFIKGATTPSAPACAKKTRACVCTRARATHAHAGAQARIST